MINEIENSTEETITVGQASKLVGTYDVAMDAIDTLLRRSKFRFMHGRSVNLPSGTAVFVLSSASEAAVEALDDALYALVGKAETAHCK